MIPPASQSSENSGPANSSSLSSVAPSRPVPGVFRKYAVYFWVGGILLAALVVTAAALGFQMGFREPFKGPIYVVKKEPMQVTIVERGSLESAFNSDIIVRVKAGGRGSTNASTIKWVVDDGNQVKLGDKIVELDDSGFQDQLKTQKNTVNDANAKWILAKNESIIQKSENESAIKTAEVNLDQSKLELKKYAGKTAGDKMIDLKTLDEVRQYLETGFDADGKKESSLADGKLTSAYLQDISGYVGTIQTAESDKSSWMDRASWSQRMVKKGFYSLSQADADKTRLDSMEIALRKAEGDLDIYKIFDREKNVAKKWSDVKEAQRAVTRVDIQAESKMRQKEADEASKKSIYDQEDERLRDLVKEGKFYTMYSPQDGMIVYYIPEQARFGGGTQQSTVAQGEPVREGQKLIRIPNLKRMLVNARVHEAMVSKVKGEKVKSSGYSERLRSVFSFGRFDTLALASYQYAYDEARDAYDETNDKYSDIRDKEQIVLFGGQPANIRVDAHPGRTFKGHVKTVATVPSQADFLSSDVKLYQTMVSIDDLDVKLDKLKPGMSAEVTIKADEIKAPVLQIPLQAVVGNVKMGGDRKCYVLDASGIPQERDIKLGMSNDTMVEVKSGLEEGDRVVLNPRSLIPENSGMKAGIPTNKKGGDFEEGGKKGAGKKDAGEGPPPGQTNPGEFKKKSAP
jgi:HlyD family secretion protein